MPVGRNAFLAFPPGFLTAESVGRAAAAEVGADVGNAFAVSEDGGLVGSALGSPCVGTSNGSADATGTAEMSGATAVADALLVMAAGARAGPFSLDSSWCTDEPDRSRRITPTIATAPAPPTTYPTIFRLPARRETPRATRASAAISESTAGDATARETGNAGGIFFALALVLAPRFATAATLFGVVPDGGSLSTHGALSGNRTSEGGMLSASALGGT